MEIENLLSSKKTELKDTIFQWLNKSANNIQIKDGVILVNNQDDYAQNFVIHICSQLVISIYPGGIFYSSKK